ncbi:THO complex subunit 5 homolog [Euwallacea fornicatus]|uniref:THO complex subunit 5 homolog n=1 Tax=Euwallacea fornicatus TaxID=995702 RepID=UPI00338F8757
MVKETSAGSPMKKKRKTASVEAGPELDIYQKVCEYEEKEAKNCNLAADSALFVEVIKDVQDHLSQVRDLKNQNDAPPKLEPLTSHLMDMVVKICIMKKLNRMDKLSQVVERETLNVEKQKCDSIKLTYQNLVYELYHLVNETNKCLAFKSDDENIQLVSLEEFMKNAPETVTSKFTDFNPNDQEQAHALRLARLEWELTQRKNLAEECKLLEEKKKKVVAEITQRKQKLSDLLPLLNSVIKATKPLQEHLGISGDVTRKEHALAALLPDPLYILYANIVAYKSVFATTIEVTILGNKDDATQFNEALEVATSNGLNEDSEPETELPEVEEVIEVKKRRHRKSVQQVDPLEEKKKKLLEVHPLKVELMLKVDDGPKLNVSFSYYLKLKLVTVSAKVDVPSNITANTAREILSGHNILSELLENDSGLESPNPGTGYVLRKMGLSSLQSLVPDIGYAYGWAQAVCGINFLAPRKYCEKFSQQNVETVLKIIKKRLANRTHLARQMQQLEQNTLPAIPDTIEAPISRVSTISKWSSTTYQNFCQAQFTQSLIDEDIVTSSDLFYSVKILRGEASLQTFVVIKNTYPTLPPIFALNLNYKGVHNSSNSDEIRDIERVLNVNWGNYGVKSSAWLLSAQLTHLCSYLDVYLESLDSKIFPPNAKFIRGISGRNRRRPYTFRKIGTGIFFTQY